MMKLVYISPDSFLDTDLSVLDYLAKEFELHWFPVYYTDRKIYYTPEQIASFARNHGIVLHPCPRSFRQRDPRNLRFYGAIVKEIVNLDADILYSCITEELWWTISSRRLTVPVKVLGLHDVVKHSYGNRLKRFIQGKIQSLTVNRFEHLCVFSQSQKSLCLKVFGREAVNLGMAGKDFGPSNMVPGPLKEGVKLLFFGNISRYKGLDLLVEALEKLYSQGVDGIKLTIAGKGEDWAVCEPLIKTPEMYNLQVRFIDNAEIPGLFSSHHFLVLPYRDATQSGPLMIAANYGLPIMAPSYGCFTELYTKDSAILYEDLSDALIRLSKLSQNEYEAMRSAASRLAERCSPVTVAGRYAEYFKELCPNKL